MYGSQSNLENARLTATQLFDIEHENEITIVVLRLLVLDLLALFNVMNQGMINILRRSILYGVELGSLTVVDHVFEMSKSDVERAVEVYNRFTQLTNSVVSFLVVARSYERQTRVEVPSLMHAPTNLGKSLEGYLADPDFEINRRQYLAAQQSKKSSKFSSKPKPFGVKKAQASESNSPIPASTTSKQPKEPAAGASNPPNLIDFFDSIEQNQQPLATQPGQQNPAMVFAAPQLQQHPQQQYPVTTGFLSSQNFQQGQSTGVSQPQVQQQQIQQRNPQHLQPEFTGAGFGGYTPQPAFQPTSLSSIPQVQAASFNNPPAQSMQPMQTGQPQTTNPFRISMMPANPLTPQFTSVLNSASAAQSTNPFSNAGSQQQAFQFSESSGQTFQHQQQQQPQQMFQPQQFQQPVQPQATGTNPFARMTPQQTALPALQQPGQLAPHAPGGTNPFRQSVLTNTATGNAWQNGQQPAGSALNQMSTIPVFPRPGQPQPQSWQGS
jgi:hypothetical protein